MCFGGNDSTPAQPVTPAPAPAPAQPAPEETAIGQTRRNENMDAYGNPRGPDTRVDRSVSSGITGGSGLAM